jgi:hypothetical protein
MIWVLTMTFSAGSPVAAITAFCARPGTCVPTQSSARSGWTCSVQFSGSIGECERNGSSYTADSFVAAAPIAATASPLRVATTPRACDARSMSATSFGSVNVPFGPASQLGFSAARPCLAAHI